MFNSDEDGGSNPDRNAEQETCNLKHNPIHIKFLSHGFLGCYMAEILTIRRKTLSNQSINQSINHVFLFFNDKHPPLNG